MKLIYFALIIFVMFAQIGFAQDAASGAKSPEAGNAYNNGLNFAKKGNFKEAEKKFQEAVTADPQFYEAFYMLAYSQRKLEKNGEAETNFKKAIGINPKFENAFVALGNLQSDVGNYDDAINSFNGVLAFNTESAKANFGLGNVYYERKEYTQAIPVLKKATELDPKYDSAFNLLGISLEQTNQLADAVSAFDAAIKVTKNNDRRGSFYFRLGGIQVKLDRYKDAESSYLNALKYSRKQNVLGGANFGLGEVYKKLGNNQKALEYFRTAARDRKWKASADYEIDMILNPDKYAY